MNRTKITKLVSGLLIVVSTLTLSPIEIYAAESVPNVVRARATYGNNTQSDCIVESTTGSSVDSISVTGISLSENFLEIEKGETSTLTGNVLPSTATNQRVTWESSDANVATVNSCGTITGVAEGSAIITCTANDGSGKFNTCRVSVIDLVTNITLDKLRLNVVKGNTSRLTETVFPNTAKNKSVIWKSNNKKVAAVDSRGIVTGVADGSAIITCKARDGSEKSADCWVTVTDSPILLDKLELINNNNYRVIDIYSDNENGKIVAEDKVRDGETYYAETLSDKIRIYMEGPDKDYIKVFKFTSDSILDKDAIDNSLSLGKAAMVDPDNINLSSGITTFIIRVYSKKPDLSMKYDDNVVSEYKIKVKK
ncbi:Ig domain protein group 2 domain protein [Clostridium sp. DL-VIII]|uniref:Ig-like domain-containing protein n=1 Tax=Clostridium sp. DL-VIII TaxID=641107 RepID=UPI00023B06ED|nr:Ig-like domain-containing protein [Clostridium sp. DL-VIII]EHJ01000.1 Ig domain protein group 2 domain protein [Clostridium sp. DL-VIII]